MGTSWSKRGLKCREKEDIKTTALPRPLPLPSKSRTSRPGVRGARSLQASTVALVMALLAVMLPFAVSEPSLAAGLG